MLDDGMGGPHSTEEGATVVDSLSSKSVPVLFASEASRNARQWGIQTRGMKRGRLKLGDPVNQRR